MKTHSLSILVACVIGFGNAGTTDGGITRRLCDPVTNTCMNCTSNLLEDENDCIGYRKGRFGLMSNKATIKVCAKTRVTICTEKVDVVATPAPVVPACSSSCSSPGCIPCNIPSTTMKTLSAKTGKVTETTVVVEPRTGA